MVLHREIVHIDFMPDVRNHQLVGLIQLQDLLDIVLLKELVAHCTDLRSDEQVVLDFLEVGEVFLFEQFSSNVLPIRHI